MKEKEQQNKWVKILKKGVEAPAAHYFAVRKKLHAEINCFLIVLIARKRMDLKGSPEVCIFMS